MHTNGVGSYFSHDDDEPPTPDNIGACENEQHGRCIDVGGVACDGADVLVGFCPHHCDNIKCCPSPSGVPKVMGNN